MHLKEFINTPSNVITFQADGHVGIGESNPLTKLHIRGGTDASISGGGLSFARQQEWK